MFLSFASDVVKSRQLEIWKHLPLAVIYPHIFPLTDVSQFSKFNASYFTGT